MAITHLISVIAGADAGLSNATTGQRDTTSASLIMLVVTGYNMSGVTPTDSASNTWTGLTYYANAGLRGCKIWYCVNPTTSANHTFTAYQAYGGPAIAAMAFSGTATSSPFDTENGSTHDGADISSFQPGSVTPSEDGSLFVCGIAINAAVPVPSIDQGFTISGMSSGHPDYFHGTIGAGYLIQGAAAARNPTFSWSGVGEPTASIAVFKPAGAGAAKPVLFHSHYRNMGWR